MNQQQLEDASYYIHDLRAAVMNAVAEVPVPASVDSMRAVLMMLDGLNAAGAMYAEASGMFPSNKDKRHLANELGAGFLKSMKDAREELSELSAANSN
jgi:hypothetical protein